MTRDRHESTVTKAAEEKCELPSFGAFQHRQLDRYIWLHFCTIVHLQTELPCIMIPLLAQLTYVSHISVLLYECVQQIHCNCHVSLRAVHG